MDWFKKHNITVLPWSSKSSDLSLIENLWSVAARCLYKGRKTYNNVRYLSEAIDYEFSEIFL